MQKVRKENSWKKIAFIWLKKINYWWAINSIWWICS